MTVPTGARAVTAGRTLPGLNANFAWDVVKDFFSLELLVANNRVKDEGGGSRHELATGLAGSFHLTKNLEGFIEWDAFYPTGGIGPAAPRHFAVGGLVYFITPNLAVDGRVGVGLNHSSNDFLVGVGFAVRRQCRRLEVPPDARTSATPVAECGRKNRREADIGRTTRRRCNAVNS